MLNDGLPWCRGVLEFLGIIDGSVCRLREESRMNTRLAVLWDREPWPKWRVQIWRCCIWRTYEASKWGCHIGRQKYEPKALKLRRGSQIEWAYYRTLGSIHIAGTDWVRGALSGDWGGIARVLGGGWGTGAWGLENLSRRSGSCHQILPTDKIRINNCP